MGREHDDGTGLVYFRARFYTPSVGRFMSVDPFNLAGVLSGKGLEADFDLENPRLLNLYHYGYSK